jgi:hypothetical protein
LHQYYKKGDYDTDETHNDKCFIWLLENPKTNEQNNKRICERFNKMMKTYDWTEPFSIGGYKLR